MRYRLCTLVMAAGLAGIAPSPLAAQRQAMPRDSSLHDTTLANGLQVLVVGHHAVPLAKVAVFVRTGAFTQDSGDEGVSHLYEHMLFKGYEGGDRAFINESSDLKAQYNGFTSDEVVGYYLDVPARNIRGAIKLLSRAIRNPHFDNDLLTAERQVVFNEFDRDMADPVQQLDRNVLQRLWTTGWRRKNPLGEAWAIAAATPARLTSIYHRYYIPNNAAVIVSGDVSVPDVLDAVNKYFGDWDRAPDPSIAHPVVSVPARDKNAAVMMTGNVKDVTVEIAWQGPSTDDHCRASCAADVFVSLVNDAGSHFQQTLVRSGLFQGLQFDYGRRRYVGAITLIGRTTPDSLAHALAALKRELPRLARADAFDSDEIADGRQGRRVAHALEEESGSARPTELGYWWGEAGLDYYRQYDAGIAAVTAADLQQFARDYIDGRPSVTGVLSAIGATPSPMLALRAFVARDSTTAAAP